MLPHKDRRKRERGHRINLKQMVTKNKATLLVYMENVIYGTPQCLSNS